MRRMKGLLAAMLSFVMILTVQLPVAAEGTNSVTMTDAKICESLGMLIGEGNGLTDAYLAQTPTRIQAALMYLRLTGLEKDALTFSSTSNFDDVDKAEWASNIMGYLKAHPELGMVGVGDNNFSPDTYITAQGYYKILLEALGYKANVDFQWEDTLSFAATKGMSKVAAANNFTVDNLATATVEALKATVNGTVDTLAGSLVRSGKFTDVHVKALEQAGISQGNLSFELSVQSASSLLVKFNTKVTDVFKVSFSVSKDSIVIDSLMGFWNEEGTELTISRNSNLDLGDYTVAVVFDKSLVGTKKVTVEEERIASIELTPKMIIKTSDIKGEVNYKAFNQYGEDISKSTAVQNILWSTTADSITVDAKNTKLVVTKNGVPGQSQLKDVKTIYITGYDASWKTAVSEELPVSDGIGLIKDIKFLGIYNKDGKAEIAVDSQDRFYIEYEALDAEGNKIDSYAILSNIGTVGLYTSNPSIAAHIVRDPENMSKALIEIDTHTASGIAQINAAALSSGKSTSITVEVKKGAVLSDFIIEALDTEIAVNERVEIPYKAYDQNGNPLSGFDEINNKILIISGDPINASVAGERSQDGKFVLVGRFNEARKYTIKIVVIETNKTSDFIVEVKPAAIPTTLSAINKEVVYDAIVENGQIRADFVNNPGFTVLDQNDREFNFKEINMIENYYYYVYAASLDPLKVGILGSASVAYKNTEIVLVGGSTKGSTTVSFELCRDTDTNPANGKEVLDVKEVAITNVDRKDIVGYGIAPIKTLYANPEITQNDTYNLVSKQKRQYAADIKIFGKMSNGNNVALNPNIGAGNNVLNLSVTDTNKFNVDLINRKLLAKSIGSDNEASDKLTATIQGANGVILTASVDIKSIRETPVAQSIDAMLKVESQIKRFGDNFTCTAAAFNNTVRGRELRRYDAQGNDTINADITFAIQDQYGNTALTPAYFAVTKSQGSGNIIIDPTTGLVSGTASSGDQYIVTAVTNNGLTKAITISIQ